MGLWIQTYVGLRRFYELFGNELINHSNDGESEEAWWNRGIGSGSARFFHPGDRFREKYPPDTRARVTGAVITGEAMRLVARRQQFCYLVTVPDIDGECYIVKKDFRVDIAPEISFESKRAPVVVAPPRPIHHEDDRAALNNIVPIVRGGDGLAKHIAELWAEGVKIDDNNEPLDEGGAPPPLMKCDTDLRCHRIALIASGT